MSYQPNSPQSQGQQKPEAQPKPQEQPKVAGQLNSGAVETNIQVRSKELINVNRIVTNAIALITDADIKGGHAGPVSEVLGWLTGFSQSLTGQIKTLESTLPKTTESKATDAAKPPTIKPIALKTVEVPKNTKPGTLNSVEPLAEPTKPIEPVVKPVNEKIKTTEPVIKTSDPVAPEGRLVRDQKS